MKTNNLIHKVTKTKGNTKIKVNIRLNDECKNGHQDFSITCDGWEKRGNGKWVWSFGGSAHDDILKFFPEFKIFVDLHLCDYKGYPMHTVENGFYHLKEGFNNTTTPEEVKEKYCEYYRILPEQYDILKDSENKLEFALFLKELGILKAWNQEAAKGIKYLEKLTGDTFIIDSKRTQLNYPDISKIKEFKQQRKEGYYTPEKKQQRAEEKAAEDKKDLISKLRKEAKDKINRINSELNLKIWLLNKFETLLKKKTNNIYKSFFDNPIYYNHTNTLSFNWRGYGDEMTEEQFNTFCDSLNQNDFNKLPSGITFELKGVKEYTTI